MKSQLNLNSSLSLSQKNGNEFNLSKAIISFSKDEATTIDSIGVILLENNKVLCHRIGWIKWNCRIVLIFGNIFPCLV